MYSYEWDRAKLQMVSVCVWYHSAFRNSGCSGAFIVTMSHVAAGGPWTHSSHLIKVSSGLHTPHRGAVVTSRVWFHGLRPFCVVCMFSLCLCGFFKVFTSSYTPKTCTQVDWWLYMTCRPECNCVRLCLYILNIAYTNVGFAQKRLICFFAARVFPQQRNTQLLCLSILGVCQTKCSLLQVTPWRCMSDSHNSILNNHNPPTL